MAFNGDKYCNSGMYFLHFLCQLHLVPKYKIELYL